MVNSQCNNIKHIVHNVQAACEITALITTALLKDACNFIVQTESLL